MAQLEEVASEHAAAVTTHGAAVRQEEQSERALQLAAAELSAERRKCVTPALGGGVV